ncbi:unnamed protein product, partial [Cyprideis torosa]
NYPERESAANGRSSNSSSSKAKEHHKSPPSTSSKSGPSSSSRHQTRGGERNRAYVKTHGTGLCVSSRDEYNFNIILETSTVSSRFIDLRWSGVPYPDSKFVNVYRVIWKSTGSTVSQFIHPMAGSVEPEEEEEEEAEKNLFVFPTAHQPKATVKTLQPGTTYLFYVEAYLTNGKIRESNVVERQTLLDPPSDGGGVKGGALSGPSSTGAGPVGSTNYYHAMLAFAIIATLAMLCFLVLLVIVVKRKQARMKGASITTGNGGPSHFDMTSREAVTSRIVSPPPQPYQPTVTFK